MQPVQVDEPTVAETITIFTWFAKKRYEDYHHVKYTDEAINAAEKLIQSLHSRSLFLPDKAIDLLDESGSKMNLTIQLVDPKTIDKKISRSGTTKKQQASAEEDFEKKRLIIVIKSINYKQ